MGKHKFKLSDMIPNAWFYKLKEIGNRGSMNTNTNNNKPMKKSKPYFQTLNTPSSTPSKSLKQMEAFTPNRASYYISTRLDIETKKLLSPSMDPPRKSKRRSRKRSIKPTCSTKLSDCTACRVRKPEPESESESNPNSVQPCTCRITTSPTDIIIDMAASERLVSKKLPRIITKQPNFDEILNPSLEEKSPPSFEKKSPTSFEKKTQEKKSPPKEVYKLKTRIKSPRVLSKHRKSNARKSDARKSESKNGALDGFAVVKSSSDPQKDFKDSMVEMIMENKICKSKDLEELLACYLSLNSAEYHDVIVKVFEQIWFDFREIRL
ncbi:hypothetical protein LUZ60_015428 [Juncus effusus]|nr:hypothetical protein LUZ60_015428 [Juncus effusus]